MNMLPMQDDDTTITAEFQNFAYSVSHDLGAPVRAMVEFSKLLSTEYSDDLSTEAKEYLSMIIGSGGKLQSMMEALLQYSRLNTMAKPMTDFAVLPVIKACVAAHKDRLDAAPAEITIGTMPPAIHGDADQIRQLFSALIDNAAKFQPRGVTAHINITSKDDGRFWRFSIADDGIGIPALHAEKIFRPLQRLHTDSEYPGVGMGLTVAQKIIRRHAGQISFESNADGTVFHFTLPHSP